MWRTGPCALLGWEERRGSTPGRRSQGRTDRGGYGSPVANRGPPEESSRHDRPQDQPLRERVDRALRPRGRPARPGPAAVPLRQDQRAEVPQAPRRASTSSTWGWATRPTRPSTGSSTSSARPRRDSKNHRYSVAAGVYNLRREVAARYEIAVRRRRSTPTTRSSRRSARRRGSATCAWPCSGRATRRWCPAPSFPIHVHAVALASANVIALDVRDPQAFLANVARVCESLFPQAQDPDPQLPAQPDGDGRRPAVLRGGRRAGEEVPASS